MPSQVFSACRAACIYACVYICTFMGASAAGDMGLFYRYNKTGMGWLRLVGSLKLYVSLKNIGLFCRALLQKRPIILRSLLIVATPYNKTGRALV